jgi:hypothetical protein
VAHALELPAKHIPPTGEEKHGGSSVPVVGAEKKLATADKGAPVSD